MVVTLAAQVPLRVLMDQRAHTLHLTLRPPKNKNKRVSTARASAAAEAGCGVIEVQLQLSER